MIGEAAVLLAADRTPRELDRPYHRAIAAEDALRELERFAGTQFEPVMVASFVALIRGEREA